MDMSLVRQVWPKPSGEHSGRGKKTRQTEKQVGRQYQGMDRPGVRQVPEGRGEQRKMEETGYEVICGAPTTLGVKGEMMMMMNQTHVAILFLSIYLLYFIFSLA